MLGRINVNEQDRWERYEGAWAGKFEWHVKQAFKNRFIVPQNRLRSAQIYQQDLK